MTDAKVSYFVCGTPSNSTGFELEFIHIERPEKSLAWRNVIGQEVEEGSSFDRTGRMLTRFALMRISLSGQRDCVLFIHYDRISPYDARSNRGAYIAVGCLLQGSLNKKDRNRAAVWRVGAVRSYLNDRIDPDRGSLRGVDGPWHLRDVVRNSDLQEWWDTVKPQCNKPYEVGFVDDVVALIADWRAVPRVRRFRDSDHLLDEAQNVGGGEVDGGVLSRVAKRPRGKTVQMAQSIDDEEADFTDTEEFRLLLVGSVGAVLGFVVGVLFAWLVAVS